MIHKIKNNKYFVSSFSAAYMTYIFLGLNFIAMMVLARILAPSDFGVLAITLSVVSVLEMIFDLSVSMAYIQKDDTPTLFGSAFVLSIAMSFIAFIISILIFFFVSSSFSQEIALFVCIIMFSKIFSTVGQLFIADFEKKVDFKKSVVLFGIAGQISLVITLLMAYMGFGEKSLIAREVFNSLFVFVIAKMYSEKKITFVYNKQEIKELIRYSVAMLFSRGSEIAFFRIPILMIGSLWGNATTGIITQMMYVVQLPNRLFGVFTEKVAFVFYSTHKESNDKNFKVIMISTVILVIVTLPFSLLLYFYPKEIIDLIFGKQWLHGADYLKYFALFLMIIPIFSNFKSYFYGMAKNNLVAYGYLISTFILVFSLVIIYVFNLDNSYLTLSYSISFLVGLLYLIISSIKHNRYFRKG